MFFTTRNHEKYSIYRERVTTSSRVQNLPDNVRVSFSLVKCITQQLVNEDWQDVDIEYSYELKGLDTDNQDDYVDTYSKLVHDDPSVTNMLVILNELLLNAEHEESSYVDEFKLLAKAIESEPDYTFNYIND